MDVQIVHVDSQKEEKTNKHWIDLRLAKNLRIPFTLETKLAEISDAIVSSD